MKKALFILLAAGFTFTSCDSSKKSETATETEVLTDTATVVQEKEVTIEKEVTTDVDTSDAEVVDTLRRQ
jgi:uncharacterized protein YcfL